MPSLYANTVSSNAVIQPNNNTSLYNPLGGPVIPVNGNITANNINVSNNVNVGGQISAVGNITTAGFFIGNGSQLTGLPASYSNANVATFMANFGSNTVSTTGNVTAGFFIGDGSQLTGLPASYGNANVAAFLPTYTGNLAGGNLAVGNNANIGGNLSVAGTIFGTFAGNISGNLVVPGGNTDVIFNNSGNAGASSNFRFDSATNIMTVNGTANVGALTATGNVLGANLIASANAVVGGINTDNYRYANGVPVSFGGTYGNANVADFLDSFGSNAIVTTGNITGGNIIGNGQNLTNLPGANVVGAVANATFATSAATATVANSANAVAGANVTGTVASATQANTANVANAVAGANVTGTVASATQANTANVANSVSGGNVTGQVANALVAGTVYVNSQPNITSVGTLSTLSVTGNTSTGGILTDNYRYANGTPISFGGTYGDSNVTTLLSAFGSNTISTTGTITSGNITGANFNTAGQVSAVGNITGAYIFGNGSQLTGLPATYSNANVTTLLAAFGSNTISTTGNISAGNINSALRIDAVTIQASGLIGGNGSALTSLTGSNVTGTVANATFATSAATATTAGTANSVAGANVTGTVASATQANSANVANSVSGGNVSGQVANALVAGTVYTAAQPAITSVGTLTSLSVSGNVVPGGVNTDNYRYANGTPVSFAGTYGNANVSAYLASGTNTANIITTGNVQGSALKTSGSGGNITGVDYIYANTVVANVTVQSTGRITAGAVSYANIDGTAGQVLTTYGNGVTYFASTGSTYGNANVNTLLAAWGSNTLSTTGNVSAGNFIGNGSALTALTGANVSGSVAQANTANTANAVAGGNVSGQVANALVAGTVYTNAQPNITSVGTLSALSVSGNIDTGGQISATGNVTAGNLNIVGSINDSSGVLQLNGSGNIVLVPVGSTQAYGPVNIIGGRLTADAVTYANVDGTNGQVLTTYGNGVTYFSTVSGGSGSPGGANTQLQFNDGGAFAGNSAMTFDVTSGNVTLGNIRFNNNVITNINSFQSNTNPNPGRILVGSGVLGNYNPSINTTSSRLAAIDQIIKYDDGLRTTEIQATLYGNLAGGNIGASNANSRLQAISADLFLINGNSVNVNPFYLRGINSQIVLGSAANTGCAFATTATSTSTFVTINAGSSANTAIMNVGSSTLNGNTGNMVGYMFVSSGGTASVTGNTYAVYMPGTTAGIASQTTGNSIRGAANYYFLRNDDDLAKAKIGMLDSFHELNANSSTTTGTVTVSKSNGQVQTIYPTGNVTIGSFTNFVTRVQAPGGTQVNTADTVTLIIQQGATPYTVTMPTGNTAIRYAGGLTTVGATANTTTMISVTGVYDYGAAANEYLVTISPEFS
jgi:hypothetical protein